MPPELHATKPRSPERPKKEHPGLLRETLSAMATIGCRFSVSGAAFITARPVQGSTTSTPVFRNSPVFLVKTASPRVAAAAERAASGAWSPRASPRRRLSSVIRTHACELRKSCCLFARNAYMATDQPSAFAPPDRAPARAASFCGRKMFCALTFQPASQDVRPACTLDCRIIPAGTGIGR